MHLIWSPVQDLNLRCSCSQSRCHNQTRRTGDSLYTLKHPSLYTRIKVVGLPGVEPGTYGLCVPAMAFATLFRFVVWTVSCLYDLPVQSLHVLSS